MRRDALCGGDAEPGCATGDVSFCAAAGAIAANSAAAVIVTISALRDIALLLAMTVYITIMADLASDPLAWRPVKAPSLAALEVLAGAVFAQLPKRFRDLCEGLVIQVDDFPSDEVLDEMGAQSEFDLLGLFQGVGLPFRSESAPVQMPNMIWLYRRPILDYWAEHEETLGVIVRHVLVHEIGHHFGLSDADMAALEEAAG
jgi:predicted Zn-dependent protease with MMP-like domain